MANAQQIFDVMIARYEKRTVLSAEARADLRALPYALKTYARHSYLVREGEQATTAKLIVEGLAYRHKVTAEGGRQILSLHIPGDFIDLEGSLLNVADHNVQVLETCTLAEVPRAAVVELIDRYGSLAHAMWIDTLIDASVYREWVANVGRRDARRAMCHLLCEFGRRLEFAGLADGRRYELPMTQEQLADCLGITPVHVNRVLRELDREGLIIRRERFIEVPDRARLNKIAGFNDLYLHLDMMVAA
jgi:CRP-like cAMP-binding protein